MDDIQIIPIEQSRTYALQVVLDHSPAGWVAYCPAVLVQGALAWGDSQGEALKNLEGVLECLGFSEKVQLLITL